MTKAPLLLLLVALCTLPAFGDTCSDLYTQATAYTQAKDYKSARIVLQTVINACPDNDYFAKAKLALADSFFQQGGTANLTTAVEEYKSFITFFPLVPETPYAQMQIAMAHFKMMRKPGFDSTEAVAAQEEFNTFLTKYPENPLALEAGKHLLDVRETLAETEFMIAQYYYQKKDYYAAKSRLEELTTLYPLYSRNEKALEMLAFCRKRE